MFIVKKMELSDEVISNKYCCIICHKYYTRKSSLDKHKILCDFKMRTKREIQIETEESGDGLTNKQLVQIVLELTMKIQKMEQKMEEMQKWVNNKKRKLNVLEWLNTNIRPTVGFLEWVNTMLVVKNSHFELLIENNIFKTIQQIFQDNLSENSDFIYPISCFQQKPGIFYICEKREDGAPIWRQLELSEMVLMLKTVQKGLMRELTKWKEFNQTNFYENDKIAILFNQAVIKLMNMSFTQDNNFSKMKNNLFNYLKTNKTDIDFNIG